MKYISKIFMFAAWLFFVAAMIADRKEANRMAFEIAKDIFIGDVHACNMGEE